MQPQNSLIPQLFRSEYRKLVSVLSYRFGMEHIEAAEDIVSDTFLSATESWAIKGIPENPTAWLYTVAKNKARNYLNRNNLFDAKITPVLQSESSHGEEIDLDFSEKNISDSQLAMIFTICNPVISGHLQISLALNLLCGFGIQEIADAFLTNKETVYKRLQRAKGKLKIANIRIQQPKRAEITGRLETVLTTIYLLFSEGYYSTSQHTVLRKEFCEEAIRLNYLLTENPLTDLPNSSALLSLMCFHASRFDARTGSNGEMILYQDQDERLWNLEMIEKGIFFLNRASEGDKVSHFHLEAAIAYWHTKKADTKEKWEQILQLYNSLLILKFSPIAALNRTYALSKTEGKTVAIAEAEKLNLSDNQFYYVLLGNLYSEIDNKKALSNFSAALSLATGEADRKTIERYIAELNI